MGKKFDTSENAINSNYFASDDEIVTAAHFQIHLVNCEIKSQCHPGRKAASKQRIRELFGVEGTQVVDALPDSYVANRYLKLVANGGNYAPFGSAAELGQNRPRQPVALACRPLSTVSALGS